MEACKICKKFWCNCQERKYEAKIEFMFYSSDNKDVENRIRRFYSMLKGIDLQYNVARWPMCARKNNYDEDVKNEIIDKLGSLVLSYSYSMEQVEQFISSLPSKVQKQVEEDIREREAELREEQARHT